MKIRHKQSGVVLEGAFDERAYWVGSTRHEYFGLVPESSTYDKKEWEEVKPEWKDVTAECELDADGDLWHRPNGSQSKLLTQDEWPLDGYRFRKVGYVDGPRDPVTMSLTARQAFIIEQRQA